MGQAHGGVEEADGDQIITQMKFSPGKEGSVIMR